MPVETLLRHVTDLIHQDRTKAGVITGTRLLRQEHFEFRGISARPEGLPDGSTRMSDSGAEPSQRGAFEARSTARASEKKGQEL